jgi:hypothetical protein
LQHARKIVSGAILTKAVRSVCKKNGFSSNASKFFFRNAMFAVIGMHFMNPVPVMKLVEIICGVAILLGRIAWLVDRGRVRQDETHLEHSPPLRTKRVY